jgi:hypothetical protein
MRMFQGDRKCFCLGPWFTTMRQTHIFAGTCCAIIALLVLGSGQANARGNGIKAGSGRLHFGIDLELIFDSNPGYFPSGSANQAMDLVLRTRPSLTLDFPSDVVAFELNGKVGYDYFLGIENSRTTDLSTVSGEADMSLGFNPNGQYSFFVIDNFSRSGDPRYTALSSRFDRTNNEIKALFQIKPGGGALTFDLAYGFFLDWFDGSAAKGLSNYGHRAYFSGKWKFLPKTALSLDFDADIRRFPDAYDAGPKNPDVNAIRATLGLIGQISPSISLIVKAGYGDSLILEGYAGAGFRSAVGQAEISYKGATTLLQGGYSRNFQPVAGFAYFGQDRFYLRFRQQLGGRFSLGADVAFDLLAFGVPIDPIFGTGSRFDFFLSGGASFEYHIMDWLSLALDYRIQSLFGDWTQPISPGATIDYNKHTVGIRIGIDY